MPAKPVARVGNKANNPPGARTDWLPWWDDVLYHKRTTVWHCRLSNDPLLLWPRSAAMGCPPIS
jgi:hypothetical protein